MIESAMDNQALVKRSLLTAGVMVGSCVLFVGTLTLMAVAIVSHAVSPPGSDGAATSAPESAATARPKIGTSIPAAAGASKPAK
jgi:hypothetical protein